MKKILALFLVAFASCASSVNTIVAIVNTIPITLNLAQINLLEVNTKDEQILAINNSIDNILQLQKATELDLTPTKRDLEIYTNTNSTAKFMKGWRYEIFGKLVQ